MNDTCQQVIIRNKVGQFLKGHSGNPKGDNGYTRLYAIIQAIKYEGKLRNTNLEKHIAKRFYTNDAVLMALLKKIAPDLTNNDKNSDVNVNVNVYPNRTTIFRDLKYADSNTGKPDTRNTDAPKGAEGSRIAGSV